MPSHQDFSLRFLTLLKWWWCRLIWKCRLPHVRDWLWERNSGQLSWLQLNYNCSSSVNHTGSRIIATLFVFNDKTILCEVWKCQVLHIPFCVWVHGWKQLFNWSLSFHLYNMSSQQNDRPLLFLLDDWKGMLPDRLTLTISFYRILLFRWENPVNERMLACFSTVTVCLLILIFLTTVPFYDKSLAPGHVWTAAFSVTCTVHKNCALTNSYGRLRLYL